MFNKQTDEADVKHAETIIGPSIKVKGNFHGKGNIIIEGTVEGSIKTDKYLFIGDQSKISANIEAGMAKIGGKVTGNIKIKGYLEILSTAKINGDIEAVELSIQKGAILNGNCAMTDKGHESEPKK